MRGDRMERFVLLPFAVGCMSESSVAVTSSPQSQYRPSLHPPPTIITNDDDECSSKSSSSWSLPKPNLSSIGIDRLFKTFSHLFVYKEEEEEEEIEIGVPTDVKHVTHIGWDGVVVNNIRGAEGLGHNNNTNISQLQDRTLQLDHHFFLNNNNERLQLRLSKTSFNDHQQLPHPNSALAASIPQTDGQQDQTRQTIPIHPDHHHFMIAAHPSSSLQTNLEEEEVEEEHNSSGRTM